jgi:hypothetical protein
MFKGTYATFALKCFYFPQVTVELSEFQGPEILCYFSFFSRVYKDIFLN